MNLIDVTVNSTTPRRKVRLGSVQELENVVSSIMAENYCFLAWKSPSTVRNR